MAIQSSLSQKQSTESLLAAIATLQQEVADLKIAKIAFNAQSELLENLLRMAGTPELEEVLGITLNQALSLSKQLTGAEHSCLVLLEADGTVKNRIGQFRGMTAEQQQTLMDCLSQPAYIHSVLSSPQATLSSHTRHAHPWSEWPEQQERVGSALSIPIIKEQTPLGILTLMHAQLGFFTVESAQLMQLMAKQIALATEYARFYGQLETLSYKLKRELEKGREMQHNFLPQPLLQTPECEIVAFFQPARQVAGDFYDTFLLPNGSVGLVIGDVCDKGVGAALFMGLFRSLLRIFSGQHSFHNLGEFENTSFSNLLTQRGLRQPQDTDALLAVSLTNDYIAENHSDLCMFATLFFGIFNPETGLLTYINGGHEAPIILGDAGIKMRLKSTGPCVGPMPNAKFKIEQVQLDPGDILLGYSDGVTDARSPEGTFFSEKGLLALLEEVAPSPSGILLHLQQQLKTHIAEADPFDDITIMVMQRIATSE